AVNGLDKLPWQRGVADCWYPGRHRIAQRQVREKLFFERGGVQGSGAGIGDGNQVDWCGGLGVRFGQEAGTDQDVLRTHADERFAEFVGHENLVEAAAPFPGWLRPGLAAGADVGGEDGMALQDELFDGAAGSGIRRFTVAVDVEEAWTGC